MKWFVIVGIVIAGVAALLVFASEPDDVELREPQQELLRTVTEQVMRSDPTRRAPERPRRFGSSQERVPSGPTGTSRKALDRFRAEDTDSGWAEPLAVQINEIATKLVGDSEVSITDVECRSTSCRLVVTSNDEGAFLRVVDAMQGSNGYLGVAKGLTLIGLSKADDGTQAIDVFLKFERQ